MYLCRSNRYFLLMYGYLFWFARNFYFRVFFEFDKILFFFLELFFLDIFDRCLNRSIIVRRELIFVFWFDFRFFVFYNYIFRYYLVFYFYFLYYFYILNIELSINVICSIDIFYMMISWRFFVMFGILRGKKKILINYFNSKYSVEKLVFFL